MPDTPIAGGDGRDYPSDMEARVRVLEEIAAGTKAMLAELRTEQRAGFAELRTEQRAGFAELRAEQRAGFAEVRAEQRAAEQRRERDFRITFGAIITTTLGLAFLIARTAHWL